MRGNLMQRRRFQKPRVKNKGGYWIAQFRDQDGRKRKVSLGPVSKTKKFDAEARLAQILEPLNAGVGRPGATEFGAFVRQIYWPFYRRKWKPSTAASNEERMRHHLLSRFESEPLRRFSREGLQAFLDEKATGGLSQSVVSHLRWDLRQMFRMALTEGYVERNPAELLFVPREARQYPKPHMTLDQVKLFFSVLDLREKVMAGLAIIGGLRPGEILALRRRQVEGTHAEICQRVYRGRLDTPKTTNSRRLAALGDTLTQWLLFWLEMLPSDPEGWLFPSEAGTPLRKDNCWRRSFGPRLKTVGLEWANFQVMRRTHACLLDELGVDPQVRADQMGHTVDVNQNKYTKSSLERRRNAVNALEQALGIQ